jgi:hypothetical protein
MLKLGLFSRIIKFDHVFRTNANIFEYFAFLLIFSGGFLFCNLHGYFIFDPDMNRFLDNYYPFPKVVLMSLVALFLTNASLLLISEEYLKEIKADLELTPLSKTFYIVNASAVISLYFFIFSFIACVFLCVFLYKPKIYFIYDFLFINLFSIMHIVICAYFYKIRKIFSLPVLAFSQAFWLYLIVNCTFINANMFGTFLFFLIGPPVIIIGMLVENNPNFKNDFNNAIDSVFANDIKKNTIKSIVNSIYEEYTERNDLSKELRLIDEEISKENIKFKKQSKCIKINDLINENKLVIDIIISCDNTENEIY